MPEGRRRALATALLVIGAVWALIILLAALTGGFVLGPISLTTSRPLRFAVIALLAGWFLLPKADRQRHAARFTPRQLLLSALAFAVAWGLAYRITRWLAFDTGAYDLSLFESTLHYTLQGKFMFAWGLNRSLFSEHFEPIVLLLLPLWAPFRHPMVLFVAQALAVSLAVVPLYRAVRALSLDARFAAFASAAYLLNSVVWQANKFDFHPELFAPLAVFWALHASVTRRWPSLYLALAFAFLIKEEMALVMLCFAPLVLKGPPARRWPHALAVAGLSVAWGVFTFKWAMPASHPEGVALHPLAGRWSHLGATYPEMALGLLTHPRILFDALFSVPFAWVLGSVGGVPLLDPLSFLVSLPPLLAHLTAQYGYAARLGAYYGLLGTCLMFCGLVFGLERAHRRWGERAALLAAVLPLIIMPTWGFLARPSAADLHAARFLETIPPTARVCAQSPIAPRLKPDVATLAMVPNCTDEEWFLFARDHDLWPLEDRAEYDRYIQARLDEGYAAKFEEGGYLFLHR